MQSAVRHVYQTRSRTTGGRQSQNLSSDTDMDAQERVFGIADMSEEILLQIARQLDLGSQLSFMLTNKYYNSALAPVGITGPSSIKDSAVDRDRAELFALEAIELMGRLPPFLSGRVALLYEGDEESQVIALHAVDAQFNVRITQYTNLHYPEDVDIDDPYFTDIEPTHTAGHTDDLLLLYEDELLYEGNCDKAELLKILCNAPFKDLQIDTWALGGYSSQLELLCAETGCLKEAAQYCYDFMRSRQWHRAVFYVLFKNSSDLSTCVVVETRSFAGKTEWYVNGKASRNDPVQPNFDAFPGSAIKVAFFCESEPCGDYWETLEARLCTKSPSDEPGVVDQVKRFLWQEDLDWQIE